MGVYQNSLHITNDTRNLKLLRDFLADCIVVSGMVPKDWQNRITLAVDEAVSNIIDHGYEEGERGEIDVIIEASQLKFEVSIVDSGKEFNPDAIKDVDIANHVKTGKSRGLGIFIMRRIMDEVRYTFKEGVKNELKMIKYFNK